jgi:hypothetical protein
VTLVFLNLQTIYRRHDRSLHRALNHRRIGDRAILPFRISDLSVNIDHIEAIITGRFCSGVLRLLVFPDLGLVTQHGVQQRTTNLYFPVVFYKALFAKFVHEEAHARTGRADHFRECFLAENDRNRLSAAFLAEIRKQQQKTSKPPFAGIEKLIDQIVFNAVIAGQKVCQEQRGKLWLRAERRNHESFRDRSEKAFFHRMRRCDTQLCPVETAFAEELALSQNPDDGFLAVVG